MGRLFREFAVTLSTAILVSLVVSLTTTPMMCARLLRPREKEPKHGRLYHASERAFNSLQSGYERSLDWALEHGLTMMLILGVTVGLTIQRYLQLRATDTDLDLYEHSIVSYERALTITQNRYDAGVAQRTDVTQARAQLESARAAAFDLAATRHTLEHAIAVLTGRPPSELTIVRTNTLPDVPETPTLIPATLLERRPDIAAAERRTAAANAQIGVARAAYFPDLSLTGTGGYESNEFSSLFSVPNRFWSLGPNLAQTIFDAGAIHAQVKQNIAAYDINVAVYRETVLTAFQDVEDNLATLKLLAQESQAQMNAAKAAELTLQITQNQYQAGTVDYLNVVVAQQTALTAERAVRDLANRRLTASVGLLKALGGGWRTSDLVH